MSRHVLFSAVKNEAPFLLEWVAYHRAIGFDTIIIFSNASDDGTDELLAALAEAGEITHVPHEVPAGVSAQGNAARLANETGLIHGGDWVLWLDADEFLNIHVGQNLLADLIGVIGDRIGMLIPWRIFGDGGNDRFGGRFISPDFTRACAMNFMPSHEVKTLFRKSDAIEGFALNGINRPKIHQGAGLSADTFLNARGEPLASTDVTLNWLDGSDVDATSRVKPRDYSWKVAQINHYIVRTPEHFALKRSRGRGWAADQTGATNTRHTPEFYAKMNRNDRTDSSILRHQAAVDAGIEALRAHAGVRAAEAIAERRTAEALMRAVCVLEDTAKAGATDFGLTLPDEEAALLRQAYDGAEVILEYGSGGSTLVAAKRQARHVFAVESDPDWATRMTVTIDAMGAADRVRVHFADIGPVGDWGSPKDRAAHRRFHLYASGVWDAPWFVQPDVVLVDGRFRVACLLTAILRAEKPMTVLFDDYVDRPQYHWVEKILPVTRMVGRMAVFDVVPGQPYPACYHSRILEAYQDVR